MKLKTILTAVLVASFIFIALAITTSGSPDWISPTGWELPVDPWQPDIGWPTGYGPHQAIDDDLWWDWYWFCASITLDNYSPYAVLTISPTVCDKIRFIGGGYNEFVEIQVYDGSWHDVYSGSDYGYPDDGVNPIRWKEVALDQTRTLTAIRFRYYISSEWDDEHEQRGSGDAQILEVDFGEVSVCWSKTENVLFIPTGCVYQLNKGEGYLV